VADDPGPAGMLAGQCRWLTLRVAAELAADRPPKAAPGDRSADTHHRVRSDLINANGTVSLRHGGKLYHIGIGRTHAGTRTLLLIQDLHVRLINAATGELIRELTLNPDRNYQPTGKPKGGSRPRT
jgi:hypothetical protein